MNIEGKNIIVTGGASGIGYSLVDKLLDFDCNVAVFDINTNTPNVLQSKKNFYYRICDVSDSIQVSESINHFSENYGPIDILINNAGILEDSSLIDIVNGFQKHSYDLWDKVIKNNLSSVFYMGSCVVEKMLKNNTKGLIINVGSISSRGNPGQTAYSASKAGVAALTKTWAKELVHLGIRVAGIAPGVTNTEMIRGHLSPEKIKGWENKIPLRRLATPGEISEGIIFIIKNDYFHGEILEINGGLSI